MLKAQSVVVEVHCSRFIGAEAEDQRAKGEIPPGTLGSRARTGPHTVSSLGCPRLYVWQVCGKGWVGKWFLMGGSLRGWEVYLHCRQQRDTCPETRRVCREQIPVLRASAFWVQRIRLGQWNVSLAWCWGVGVFLGPDMVCHLQPRAWVQLSFWTPCGLDRQSPLHHTLPSAEHGT